ncbi:MAG: type III-B CRISPR module RAMP protein Cmr4 [Xanthomonadaceae bacterium]|nr:type III-B CRISPR module RAMP protein Cmr4 [Xanthomonadaceae bacterium]
MNGGIVSKPYWLHCLSPLHIGAGQGAGYIDNPIMREKVTGWPFVPGSSVKGVLRDLENNRLEESKKEEFNYAFGVRCNDTDRTGANDMGRAGALMFSDASIVCLPVRSLFGTFAWCTAPLVLKRLKRNLGLEMMEKIEIDVSEISIGKESVLHHKNHVFLEDLDLSVEKADTNICETLADKLSKVLFPKNSDWAEDFKKRFAIVSDDVFNFLCENGTQVDTRIRLEDGEKIVAKGALWTEEYLPMESILSGVVHCETRKSEDKNPLETFCSGERTLQLGGLASIGKGRVRCLFGERDKQQQESDPTTNVTTPVRGT